MNSLIFTQLSAWSQNPFGTLPQEDVTSAEYQRSLEGLHRFAEIDITTINTIEDLSARASLIGHDLRTVVLAKGEVYEQQEQPQPGATEPPQIISRAYRIKRRIGDHTLLITANNEFAGIASYIEGAEADQQADTFSIGLPANRDIAVASSPSQNLQSLMAVEFREGRRISYFPAMQPTNAEVQKGFAHLLQESVKLLLPELPPPTSITFTFLKS